MESRSPYYEPHEIILEETCILGKGSFGIVYKGKLSVADGDGEIALKLLTNINGEPIKVFSEEHKKEIDVLLKARHKNIVQFFGVVKKSMVSSHNQTPFFSDFLIFEFMANGNARDYVRETERNKEILLEISLGIASGMEYLHDHDIIHRDLAARNILIDSKHQAKISDFGLSRIIDEDHNHYPFKTQDATMIPNYRWVACECLQTGKFSKSSDIWSFGVTLWEIWNNGETPYGNMDQLRVILSIGGGQSPMSFEMAQGIPGGIKQLLEDIFVGEYLRPNFVKIKSILRDIKECRSSTMNQCSAPSNINQILGQMTNMNLTEEPFYSAKSNISKLNEISKGKNSEQNFNKPNLLDSRNSTLVHKNLPGINGESFNLNCNNVGILKTLLENYTVYNLYCDDISVEKIPEILGKFKGTQILYFYHTRNSFGECKYKGSRILGTSGATCIFKLPHINGFKNLKELYLCNLEIDSFDIYPKGPVYIPPLEILDISLCNIRGNFIESIISRLYALKMIGLWGNIPLLEVGDVEALLKCKSLININLNKWKDRQVISGSFSPSMPNGQFLDKINQNSTIKYFRNSCELNWNVSVTPMWT